MDADGYAIKCENIGDGLRSGAVSFEVVDDEGTRHHISSYDGLRLINIGEEKFVPVGYPVGRDGEGNFLFEFPVETDSGNWRAWFNAENGNVVGLVECVTCKLG